MVCNQQPFRDSNPATLGLADQNTCSPRGLRFPLAVAAVGGRRSYQARMMRPSSYGRKTRMASGYTDTDCTRTRCLGTVDLQGIVVIPLLRLQVFLPCQLTTTSLCRTLARSIGYSRIALRNKRLLRPTAPHRTPPPSSRANSSRQTSTHCNPRMRRGSCRERHRRLPP